MAIHEAIVSTIAILNIAEELYYWISIIALLEIVSFPGPALQIIEGAWYIYRLHDIKCI